MAISAPTASSAPLPARSGEALTDTELVAAVRRGCDRAFEQLYARYHRRIAAYVYGMVNDHGRAEDISQDVFMSALRRMRATDQPIVFKPWIYEIAKNACIDQFRRTRRGEEISYDAEDGLAATERSRLVTNGPSPAAQVDQKQTIDNLRGAFGGLSATHHEILVLREFEGLSYREIGERLDMSRASVESTLFRARRRLTEEYEELVSGERCRRVQGLISTAGDALTGVRNQRRLSAHLSHCQACRRQARHAGLDEALFVAPRGLRAKVAAFFPLPAFLQRRGGADPTMPVADPSPSVSALAQLSASYGASIDPAVASWAKAALAAATIAVAGAAGGAAVSDESREYFGGARPTTEQPRRVTAIPAPPAARSGSSPSTAPAGATPNRTRRPTAAASRIVPAKGTARPGRTVSAGGAPAAAASAPAVPDLAPEKVVGGLAPKAPVPAAAVVDPAATVKDVSEKVTAGTTGTGAVEKGLAEGAVGDVLGAGEAVAGEVVGKVAAGSSVLGG